MEAGLNDGGGGLSHEVQRILQLRVLALEEAVELKARQAIKNGESVDIHQYTAGLGLFLAATMTEESIKSELARDRVLLDALAGGQVAEATSVIGALVDVVLLLKRRSLGETRRWIDAKNHHDPGYMVAYTGDEGRVEVRFAHDLPHETKEYLGFIAKKEK